jgi:hypothetical protein
MFANRWTLKAAASYTNGGGRQAARPPGGDAGTGPAATFRGGASIC